MTFEIRNMLVSIYSSIQKRESKISSLKFPDIKDIVQEISYRCVAMQLLKKGIRIPLTAKA